MTVFRTKAQVFLVAFFFCVELLTITNAKCPNIISRNTWGAELADAPENIPTPVEYIIIHHTVTPTCLNQDACSRRLVSIQNYHINQKKFRDIGYNFLIGGDGEIYEGSGWHIQGTHTMGWNNKSLGIGFIGDFTDEAPSDKQLKACRKLIRCGVELGEIDEDYKLLGARSLRPTLSPGDALFKKIQNWKGFTRTA